MARGNPSGTGVPSTARRQQLGDGRDHLFAVRGERRVLRVVLEVDRELVDAEARPARRAAPPAPRPARGCRTGRRRRPARTRCACCRPAVLVVVIALPSGDVVGERARHSGAVPYRATMSATWLPTIPPNQRHWSRSCARSSSATYAGAATQMGTDAGSRPAAAAACRTD